MSLRAARPHPRRSRWARALLSRFGWEVVFEGLPGPHGVLIVYPHTSNWDFVVGMLTIWVLDLPIRWLGKESLFRGVVGAVLGPLLRSWGGRPVERGQASGAVQALAAGMRAEPWCWIALSPEGTRRRTEHFRSGFYHLARAAEVPVGLAYFDYPRRRVGVGPFVAMSGDIERDLEPLRAFYADKAGLRPALAGRIALRPAQDADARPAARATTRTT